MNKHNIIKSYIVSINVFFKWKYKVAKNIYKKIHKISNIYPLNIINKTKTIIIDEYTSQYCIFNYYNFILFYFVKDFIFEI